MAMAYSPSKGSDQPPLNPGNISEPTQASENRFLYGPHELY